MITDEGYNIVVYHDMSLKVVSYPVFIDKGKWNQWLSYVAEERGTVPDPGIAFRDDLPTRVNSEHDIATFSDFTRYCIMRNYGNEVCLLTGLKDGVWYKIVAWSKVKKEVKTS